MICYRCEKEAAEDELADWCAIRLLDPSSSAPQSLAVTDITWCSAQCICQSLAELLTPQQIVEASLVIGNAIYRANQSNQHKETANDLLSCPL